jgi:acyl-homoserine-lactone acylase
MKISIFVVVRHAFYSYNHTGTPRLATQHFSFSPPDKVSDPEKYSLILKRVAVMKKLCTVAILSVFSLSAFSQKQVAHKGLRHTLKEDVLKSEFIDPSQIDIVRDSFGVPHIFAKTDPEVAYGLAWAHAEDDFETIQKALLASRAMMGLYSGKDGAIIDYVVHLLRIRDLVSNRYEKDISADFKLLLNGYCQGLNAYAESYPRHVFVKKLFPASPVDVLTYSVLQLALGCGLEKAIKEILDGTTELVQWEPSGSNALALNSNKTADGNVYLTINTHHPLEGQVAWYEAHLSSEQGWNIVGGLFPGSPVIFTGFNENLGWTHTVNHPDRLDVYQLQMNPENDLQYNVDNTWHTLEERTVKLKVKVSAINVSVKKKAYWSIYGPTMVTEKGVFSIRTPGIMDIRGLEQWYRMNKAGNFTEFKKALDMQAHPSYNIVYGDRYDTIYYLSNGKMPMRDPHYDWKEILPGNTSQTLWTKFHPVENLPQVLNPPSGYVYNVNHSPFNATACEDNISDEDYDLTMGYETHDNNRSLRVMELIDQQPKISYEHFKGIKYDLQLPRKLAYPVNIDTLFLLSEVEYPELARLIRMLKTWDRKATIDSENATVFAVLFYFVAGKYQHDENFKVMTKDMCVKAMFYAKDYLMNHFGSLKVPLGEYQRLIRGDKSLPIGGIPDVLATMYSTPIGDGRMKATIGDCYIAFARYTPDGPEIESINNYGASNRIGSRHYDDQMKLYQQHQTKKMTLNRSVIYHHAEQIYNPEALSKVRVAEKLTETKR